VFVKKSYLSSCVFTAMQSVHMRMKLSLSPPLKKSWIRLCSCLHYLDLQNLEMELLEFSRNL